MNLAEELAISPGAVSIVLFAHVSGSSRQGPPDQLAAEAIREPGTGTLLFDLRREFVPATHRRPE